MEEIELFARAASHAERIAIVDAEGAHTYQDLREQSAVVARSVAALAAVPDTGRAGAVAAAAAGSRQPARVAYLVSAGFRHVATQWGIWRAGLLAVPLSDAQAPAEWSHVIADSDASLVVTDPTAMDRMRDAAANVRVVTTAELFATRTTGHAAPPGDVAHEAVGRASEKNAAILLYTSGTTGKPKGVVLTHANLEAQVRALVAAWEWRPDDRVLHVLPLNHVHGIVNVLTCALWAGAVCEMLPRFDAGAVWTAIAGARLTLFMAVPTVYARLIGTWETAPPTLRVAMSNGCRAMRLMVSGSAALPVRVLERWREISGHTLLERYGMTEIGMALSNPLRGDRRPGFVGLPLPGVEVRIVDEAGEDVAPGTAGELEVRGPGVFREYWRRPDATASAFRDGWFRTGDVALLENGMYRLLGRQSVDIIKSGGYKISALEIEEVLREHPAIAECAVVGIEDAEWGERVAVAVVARASSEVDIETLREWARPKMARYKLPSRLAIVPELPRNAMGKVSKPAVKRLFAPEQTAREKVERPDV